MAKALNTGAFEALDQQELMCIDGGSTSVGILSKIKTAIVTVEKKIKSTLIKYSILHVAH